MPTTHRNGRRVLPYSALTRQPPKQVQSLNEYELATEWQIYLEPGAAQRLAELERVKLREWRENVGRDGRCRNRCYGKD